MAEPRDSQQNIARSEDQERSGPTPAQVEALARAKMKRLNYQPGLSVNEAWDEAKRDAAAALAAIAAGEVPHVLVAKSQRWEWSVVLANGHRLGARSEGIARTWAAEVAGSVERRLVGPWVPADEEASDG